ncbi:hypothetical protein DFJ73DRAFT_892727 [Zopfochytrium polystomum]|nr:hypothetical protein DFJ73DRAFT_892727 [Zopfochytrium polystomum]
MHLTSIFSAVTTAALLLSGTPTPTLATVCGGPRDGLICMSSECGTGNGVWLKTTPLITGISLSNFDLNFPAGQSFALASSKGVKIAVSLPDALSGLFLSFTKASASIGVGLPGGQPVGSLTVKDAAASADSNSNTKTVTIDLNKVVFAPASGDAAVVDAFTKVFALITTTAGDVPLGMSGYATNSASISDVLLPGMDATDVCLENIKFSVTSSLVGLGGLKETNITSIPVLQDGNPSFGLKLGVKVSIKNPSTITLTLNTAVTLALMSNGQTIGSVVLNDFALGAGVNNYDATGFLFPDASNAAAVDAASKVVENFVAGKPSAVSVGKGSAAGLHALDAALGSLSINQTLPGSKGDPLIVNGTSYVNTLASGSDNGVPNLSLGAKIVAVNPFDIPVSIASIKGIIRYKGVACLTIDANKPFAIPAKGQVLSPLLTTVLPNSEKGPKECTTDLLADLTGTAGKFIVDIESTLGITVNEYGSTFAYTQKGVNIFVNFDDTPTA